MVVVTVRRRIEDGADVDDDVALVEDGGVARAPDLGVAVLGQQAQHGARQHLVAVELAVVRADHPPTTCSAARYKIGAMQSTWRSLSKGPIKK